MTSPKAPSKPRGWVEAVRGAALRFNDRLSKPVFLRSAGTPAAPPRLPDRPGVRVPVGLTRETG